jgi:transcriptional antiterminator RfaH
VSFWAAAVLAPQQEALALHCLALAGYTTYLPHMREQRVIRGRKILTTPPLFPGYCFVVIQLQWHAARWAPGTRGLIMDGMQPARVPDRVIAELHAREHNGLVVLPKPRGPCIGSHVKVTAGPFSGQLGIYDGARPHERVAVLLTLLGGQQRASLPRSAIEPG